jgi:peroxiredoxin
MPMRWMTIPLALLLTTAAASKEGDDRLGKPAPSLASLAWLRGRLEDADLQGQVTLLRWWTDGCRLCVNTAPALNRLHSDFARQGLAVIGVYHPKPPGPRSPDAVLSAARRLGFRFPVALDEDWTVLRRWWLGSGDRSYTSVTFLIGRDGRVRYVHPGGEFFPSERAEEARQNREYLEIREVIQRLLHEKPARPS